MLEVETRKCELLPRAKKLKALGINMKELACSEKNALN